MMLTDRDRVEITDLINRHGHLTDAGELDRWDELFTPDVSYHLDDFGLGTVHGLAALREASLALGDANPVGHHVTNIVITPMEEDAVLVRSKGIGVNGDGTAGSVRYDDVVVRAHDGWRISRRTVSGRRVALAGRRAGPHEVLARYRGATIAQSADDLRRLYAVDAVHEFPFTGPGLPGRLQGRDEIVDWIVSGWRSYGLRYRRYRDRAVHDTADQNTIVVEQEVIGTNSADVEFVLPNVIVLTVQNGQIAELRDYADLRAAAAAIGRDIA